MNHFVRCVNRYDQMQLAAQQNLADQTPQARDYFNDSDSEKSLEADRVKEGSDSIVI